MRLNELKAQLAHYDFELLHGLNELGALDTISRTIAARITFCLNSPNLTRDTFIFRKKFVNECFGCVGLLIKDAEILEFSSTDEARMEESFSVCTKDEFSVQNIEKYLKLYQVSTVSPGFCRVSVTNIEWGEIWINPSPIGFLSYIRQAIQFAKENNLPILEVNQNWELVKYL